MMCVGAFLASFHGGAVAATFASMETMEDRTKQYIDALEEKAMDGDTDAIRTIHQLKQEREIELLRKELFGV